MVKNVVKIISVILLSAIIVNMFSTNVFARPEAQITDGGGGGGSGSPKTWADIGIKKMNTTDSTDVTESVKNIIGPAITVAQVIGVGVAIIMLIVLAMKYMMAAPGDKADIKKHATVYVIGAVILFSVTAILGIIKNFAQASISA